MNGFKGFEDKDYEMSPMTAGTVISLFLWVMAIVVVFFIG